MHIPDGFLDAKTLVLSGVFSAAGVSTAMRNVGRHLQPRRIPLIGLTAAFIFVAQMINFPVAGGTSGHLIGATLAVVLLGPSAGIIIMTCVMAVQAFLFADGGVFALGANVLNMAVIAPIGGYVVYRLVRSILLGRRGQLVAASVASWCATVLAAIFCAGELVWSGTAAWQAVFPAMVAVHLVIGMGEALITMLVLAAVLSGRPELLPEDSSVVEPVARSASVAYGALVIIGLLILVVPHASPLPDGLERIAASLGFDQKAVATPVLSAPLSDYRIPWSASVEHSVMLATLIGAGAVFICAYVLARLLVPRLPQPPAETDTPERTL